LFAVDKRPPPEGVFLFSESALNKKKTILDIQRMKADGEKIAVLTCYDYPTARIMDGCGIDMLLVGDSVGVVFSGYENTLPVTLDEMVYHSRAVARGVARAHGATDPASRAPAFQTARVTRSVSRDSSSVADPSQASPRRTSWLTATDTGLPSALAGEPGLESGYMLAQYTAAALVSENKVLCHPASVDSIPTSAGQEDHVSMGNAAGLKAWQVLANAEWALAIELLAGVQAVEFLAPLEPGAGVAAARGFVRSLSPRLTDDRSLAGEIDVVAGTIRDGSLVAAVEDVCGGLE
jgi:hypothetical protein